MGRDIGMTHRFLKASPAVYESMRLQIDAAWRYPTPHTDTSIPPADQQHKAADGDCIMGVKAEWTTWEPVATLLPQMLAAGLVAEISAAEYWAAMPQPPLPG
jgi:hypothetical protein